MTKLERIYRDEKRIADFKTGMRHGLMCAAEFVDGWEGQPRKFRLGDLLLMKFDQRKKPPRRVKKKSQAGHT